MSVYEIVKERKQADLLFIPCIQGKSFAESCQDAKSVIKHFSSLSSVEDFTAEKGSSLVLYPLSEKEPRICLVGLGKNPSACSFRDAYAEAVRTCLSLDCKTANVLFPTNSPSSEILEATLEGLLLGNYLFTQYKAHSHKKRAPSLFTKFHLVTNASSSRLNDVEKSISSVYFTRDLVNTNADEMTPHKLAETAVAMGKKYKNLEVEILDKKSIEKEKMGLLLAVNKGSHLDPRFLVLSYKNAPDSAHKIAFVGKGVTYDTGGLSLKPTQFMQGMKADMGGAATVLGVMDAIARCECKVNALAFIPTTENAIGPGSYKVGDVYTSFSGKTVEIDNTDAEGRLILADALSYAAKKYKPDLMIDLATLTGAIVVALGEDYAGLFSNNAALEKMLQKAGKKTGEGLWPMPLHRKYFSLLKSDFADTKNSGSREAGSITAALFLREFIEDLPWAHLDIAGSAFRSRASGCHPKNATGEIVRTLLQFVCNLDDASFQDIKKDAKMDCSS